LSSSSPSNLATFALLLATLGTEASIGDLHFEQSDSKSV
jgi:hypothetical protein